jgi:hypothetical protein
MNQLEELAQKLKKRFPEAKIEEIVKPRYPDGFHWLDIYLGDKRGNVQWESDSGFGVSLATAEKEWLFGEGPDTIVKTLGEAYDLIEKFLGA